MVATNVPAAASRTTAVKAKTAVALLQRRIRLRCRFDMWRHDTVSLSVAIGVCVIGHPQMASDNSGVFAPELCVTAKTGCFTIVVMAASL